MEKEGVNKVDSILPNKCDQQEQYGRKSCPIPCLDRLRRKTNDCTGFGLIRIGNGPIQMSNIFLSTAFITLAQNQMNCYEVEGSYECTSALGFKPSSLISLIGFAAGILSAIFLPFVGAVIDFTPNRRLVGMICVGTMITIQALQSFTSQSNWFIMALLQILNGFVFQVHTVALFAYLPEIARAVGEKKMTKYTTEYSVLMFASEALYMMFVICIGVSFHIRDDVGIARLAQAAVIPTSGFFFFLGWYFLSPKAAVRDLPANSSLVTAGFTQVFRTSQGIYYHYSSSLGWFYLAVSFAEAGAQAFSVVAITYLKEVVDLNSVEIGLVFLIVLVSTVPGSYIGAWVTKKTDPKVSIQIQLGLFISMNFLGFLTMVSRAEHNLAYIYGAIWGALLGWYFPCENLIFSISMPSGQESELTGFFLYCTQIIAWLPPLVFTIMNENHIPLNFGGIHLNIYFIVAIICFSRMAPWTECISAASNDNLILQSSISNDSWNLGII